MNSHMGPEDEIIVQVDLEGYCNTVSCIGPLKGRHTYPFVKNICWITVTLKVKYVIRLIVPCDLGMTL